VSLEMHLPAYDESLILCDSLCITVCSLLHVCLSSSSCFDINLTRPRQPLACIFLDRMLSI
jgi:hypothetical protein